MRWLRSIPLLLLLALPAWAWEVDYTVTLTPLSPRYELPTVDLSDTQGGGANNVRYQVYSFTAPFTSWFSFMSYASWDNFMVLYRGSFNPNQPLVNAVVANDNAPTVGTAGFTAVLTGGEQYFVVTSRASNGGGVLNLASNNIRSIPPPVGAVPEPSTWLMLGAGLAVCGWRQRRQVRALKAAPDTQPRKERHS